MDLIYARFNGNKINDINVLQDYSFDEVYGQGDNVNDFELKVQKYNHKCNVNDIVYVEFTEYGGIIDRIETNTKNGEITYKGRTWHGILNSYVIAPENGAYVKVYSGEPNAIIEDMIYQFGLDNLFEVDAVAYEDRTDEVINIAFKAERLYDAILKILEKMNGRGKMLCYYHNGKVHIGAVMACDYSISDEFDTSQMPYKCGVTLNNINHLVCLGKADDYEKRPIIHLYTDENGKIQPYTLINNPQEDSEYILDDRNKVLTGLDERTEMAEFSSNAITNYKQLPTQPSDWNVGYKTKYYENTLDADGNEKKKLIPEVKRTEFRLMTEGSAPGDWRTNFTDYYEFKALENGEEPKRYYTKDKKTIVEAKEGDLSLSDAELHKFNKNMKSVKQLTQDESEVVWTNVGGQTPPEDWLEKFAEYYEDGSDILHKQNVTARTFDRYGCNEDDDGDYYGLEGQEHNGVRIPTIPPNWITNYKDYTTKTKNALGKWVWGVAITGIPQSHMEVRKQKDAPEDWQNIWRQFYYKVSKKSKVYKNKNVKKIEKKEGYFITASDAVAQQVIKFISEKKKYPKYQAGKFWLEVQDAELPPSFDDYNNYTLGYYGVYIKYTHSVAPQWVVGKNYYKKSYNSTPTYQANKYYKKFEDVEEIPIFGRKPYYYAVVDNYKELAEQGVEKLKTLLDTSTLDVDLELTSEYDVGDILGTVDDTTGTMINKPILRKIIKIKKDIPSVEYEVI